MEFDKKVYFDFLQNRDIDNAVKYLVECVPDYLYKFYSLSEKENDELDQKKLNTISENCNWYDIPENQNDPFDMRMAYIDEDIAETKGAISESVKMARCLLDELQHGFALCSFTNSDLNNLPMWAFYANNHRGFCVKYKVNKKQMLFRVFYEKDRVGIFATIINLYVAMVESEKRGQETKELECYRHILMNLINCKHISWNNEKEFRIIIPSENHKGLNVSNEIVGIKPVELYMGIKCSLSNQKKLIEICKSKISCKAYAGIASGNKFLEFTEVK